MKIKLPKEKKPSLADIRFPLTLHEKKTTNLLRKTKEQLAISKKSLEGVFKKIKQTEKELKKGLIREARYHGILLRHYTHIEKNIEPRTLRLEYNRDLLLERIDVLRSYKKLKDPVEVAEAFEAYLDKYIRGNREPDED
jgi:hypothetical protein